MHDAQTRLLRFNSFKLETETIVRDILRSLRPSPRRKGFGIMWQAHAKKPE